MNSPRDRLWVERAKRRYGRIMDAAMRWPSGVRQDMVVHAVVLLMRLDRKAFVALGR